MSSYTLKRLLAEADAQVVDDHSGHDHGDGTEGSGEEDEGIDVDTFKIIVLVCMIVCVAFGLIPKLWGKCRDSENTLSLLNCFSAGIFLGMALIHMMPESNEIYLIWAASEGIERAFPLPYVMFFVGYLLILAIDRVAARAYHAGHDHGDSGKEGKPISANMMGSSVRPTEGPRADPVSLSQGAQPGVPSQNEAGASPAAAQKGPFDGLPGSQHGQDGQDGHDVDRAHTQTDLVVGTAPISPQPKEAEAKTSNTVSKAAAIILVLALGAHAFFEGIAFGLQTTVESAGQLAAGILIHKTAAAVSLGGAFSRTGYSTKEILLFLGIFSIIAPIGIIIGMSIADSNKLVDVTFLGLSGGTFIYVACSEIIVAEFDKGKYQWLKLLLVFLGGLIITILWFFGEHSHAEGEDHAEHDHRIL